MIISSFVECEVEVEQMLFHVLGQIDLLPMRAVRRRCRPWILLCLSNDDRLSASNFTDVLFIFGEFALSKRSFTDDDANLWDRVEELGAGIFNVHLLGKNL